MKTIYLSICFSILFSSLNIQLFSQVTNHPKHNPDRSQLFPPVNDDSRVLKSVMAPGKSFYQQKAQWPHLIDSTWGPGASLADKLKVFNAYAQVMHDNFCNFKTMNLNYDSLYNHYLGMIKETTSKGTFSSIMSRFACDFKDGHATAVDQTVVNSSNVIKGLPILVTGTYVDIHHSGVVTTVLPDSTTLVLRVTPDHPLGLEPGDIILGYEGVPWKKLVWELINGGIPWLPSLTGGNPSTETYQFLSGAALNWHLFNTIDIIKHASGNTVHLSLEAMKNLKSYTWQNNEQLPVKNIPIPNDLQVSYGKLENTNIGYIYLPATNNYSDDKFFEAVDSLKNTDGLIIDMRLNFSGDALFARAFNLLFNESQQTVASVFRCDKTTFEVCRYGDETAFQINDKNPDYYDRPIAVLIGPSCFSMGDITAQRLKYHPMVRFFGKSTNGTMYRNGHIESFPDWYLEYPVSDFYHVNHPGHYLNQQEFMGVEPVWFNKDDVAKGIDPIVEKSLEWMNHLVYGHSTTTEKLLYLPGDTVTVKTVVQNPSAHQVSVNAIIESLDRSKVDTIAMEKTDLTAGNQWQVKWVSPKTPENIYWISILVNDLTDNSKFTNKHVTRITNIPLTIDHITYTASGNNRFKISPFLKNEGQTQTISKITITAISNDPWVKQIIPSEKSCADLLPGEIKEISSVSPFLITFDPATYPGYFNLKFSVSSDGWPYWVKDTTLSIAVGIAPDLTLLEGVRLDQNFPNPFTSSSTIGWQLSKGERVTLSVTDLLGRKVMTLEDGFHSAGRYQTSVNAALLPKGVYFYQLKAGKFVQTRKMIVVR